MTKRSYFEYINYVLLAMVGILTLYPFLFIFILSLNEGTDTMRGGIVIFPRAFTLINYKFMLANSTLLKAYRITILRTLVGTVGSVFITALVAYGLSDPKLPGRSILMIYLLIPMLFSGGLIPYYLQLRNLRLINTFWVYIVPGLFNIWNCIVMKTFFQGIPESLKDAARIDGANEFQILFRVVFPVSLPMFAAISLFVAVGHWNDWFSGAFFVYDPKLVPVQTYLQQLMTQEMEGFRASAPSVSDMIKFREYSTITSLSLRMAAVCIGTLPIICLYPFLQRYFIKGVLIGSLKD
jgi:putative aldouronate transport system permease protein